MTSRLARLVRLAAAACTIAAPAGAAPDAARAPRLPPIVFVSRARPAGADSSQVPGLGPLGVLAGAGGRLMLREPDGRLRALLPADSMADVASPDVSWDGARVAFAGRRSAADPWRIYVVGLDGRGLACVDAGAGGAPAAASGQSATPCWLGARIVFARADGRQRSSYDPREWTWNLAVVDTPGAAPRPLTFDHNGALDPAWDAAAHRLLFARWWYNPARVRPDGTFATDGARPGSAAADTSGLAAVVNQWQVLSAEPVLDARGRLALVDTRLAAGGVADRRAGMGIQPAAMPGGDVVATFTRNPGLVPAPGPAGVQRFRGVPSAGARLAGAAIGEDRGDPYAEGRGLSAPSACAPAPLPDGSLLVAMDRGGRGDFGIWRLPAGGGEPERIADLPGTLELDPSPVVRRAAPRLRRVAGATPGANGPPGTFAYRDRDVFAGAGAPPRAPGARLRVYRLVPPDSADSPARERRPELVGEFPVSRSGAVSAALPAHTPLFETLVDPAGRALATAHGPAQVRGFNWGSPLAPSRCVGCHLGHSARR